MLRNSASVLAALAVVVTSAGCARSGHRASAADTPPSAPRSSPACQAAGTLTEADNGRTVCLTRSARLEVYLHGTAQDRWSPIRLTGDALRPVPSGKGMLQLGVTGGFFVADRPGTARLTSTRPSCGGTPSSPAVAPVSASGTPCASSRAVEITVIVP